MENYYSGYARIKVKGAQHKRSVWWWVHVLTRQPKGGAFLACERVNKAGEGCDLGTLELIQTSCILERKPAVINRTYGELEIVEECDPVPRR